MKIKFPAIIFSVICVLQLSLLPSFAAEKLESFKIQQVRGASCKIQPEGASEWKSAKDGDEYKEKSIGKTGGDGNFTVAFDDNNRFRLLAKTEVVISPATRASGFRKVNLGLAQGKVEVELEAFPKDHEFKVQTPTAVCGAVGTKFIVTTDAANQSTFTCQESSITARPLDYNGKEYDGFVAEIGKGKTLEATVTPGEQNSYASLKTDGGTIPIAVGSEDNKKFEVKEGSRIELAQEQTEKTEKVALKVEKGGLKGLDSSYYLVDGKEVTDYSSKVNDQDGPALVNNYLAASKEEGKLKSKLERAEGASESDIKKMEGDLKKAADKATDARRKMMDARDVMRRVISDSLRSTTTRPPGGGGMPR